MSECLACEGADPHQKCEGCGETVCRKCAAYNEWGDLFCPRCIDDEEWEDGAEP